MKEITEEAIHQMEKAANNNMVWKAESEFWESNCIN
jgi:hypothetical protein